MYDKIENLRKLSDRELLILVVERQGSHLESHKQLSEKVGEIETKILDSFEKRLRAVEDAATEKRGAFKFWTFIIGIISVASLLVGLSKM
jgi:hypothetical protein